VIPRYQYFLVYVVIVAAGAVGLGKIGAAASSASDAVRQLQQSRVDQCEQANVRHDRTIKVLDAQIARLPAAQRRRALAQRPGTVALIEALAPSRDCREALAVTDK
jgi:hypothetical protein